MIAQKSADLMRKQMTAMGEKKERGTGFKFVVDADKAQPSSAAA